MEKGVSRQTPNLTFDTTSAESTSNAVVRAVATIEGKEPMELSPLNRAVDPDALDALFDSGRFSTDRTDIHLEFSYAGYRIQLAASGEGELFEGA